MRRYEASFEASALHASASIRPGNRPLTDPLAEHDK